MSRYIDADALAKKLTDWSTGTVEPIDWSDIAEAPTIDAVSVVRCKECKWWIKQSDSIQGRCALSSNYPTGEWFCANGEREGE